MLKQMKNFQPWLYNPFTVFGPMIETNSSNAIIPEHPADLMNKKKLKNIPWIISVVSEEALYPAAGNYSSSHKKLAHPNLSYRLKICRICV